MGKAGRPVQFPGTKIFHLRIPLETLSHLGEVASGEGGRTVASVIRQAVDEFLKKYPRPPEDFSDLLSPAPKPDPDKA